MTTNGRKTRTVNVLKLLARHLEACITGTPPPALEQRVDERIEQRVTDVIILATIPEIQRVSNATRTTHHDSQQSNFNASHANADKNSPACNKGKYTGRAPKNHTTSLSFTRNTVPHPAHHQ
jgi:hypothetical protein